MGRQRCARRRTDFSPFGGGGEGGVAVRSVSEYRVHRKDAENGKEEEKFSVFSFQCSIIAFGVLLNTEH